MERKFLPAAGWDSSKQETQQKNELPVWHHGEHLFPTENVTFIHKHRGDLGGVGAKDIEPQGQTHQ